MGKPLMDELINIGAWGGCFALAWFSAYVALDLSRASVSRNPLASLRYLSSAALALSIGCIGGHVIAMLPEPLSHSAQDRGVIFFEAWLFSWTFGLAGLWLHALSDRTEGWHTVLGALAFGASVCAGPALSLLALGVQPSLSWNGGMVLLGWVVSSLLIGLGMTLMSAKHAEDHLMARQVVASLVMGAAMMGGHASMLSATSIQSLAARTLPLADSHWTFALGFVIGAPCALIFLLLSSVIERRVKDVLRKARDEVVTVAQTDVLTLLPNRARFEQMLREAVASADAQRQTLALLFINLDGLKGINESFGQSVGDGVLCEMAERLRATVAPEDVVARAGGDEFLLILEGNPTESDAAYMAKRLLKAMHEPCLIEGRELMPTCSIGITIYPEHGALSKLIPHAAAATRAVKRHGGAAYCFFEPSMVAGARDQVDLLRDLRRALQNQELELYYQPKVNSISGQVTGVEALMRWHHPQRGVVGPTVFVPMAERSGLIQAIGNWLIEDVCRQIREWQHAGLRMRVALNLSVHQLRQADLVPRVLDALKRHQVDSNLLTCEITESVAMDDTSTTLRVIEALSCAGIQISIDDFGTGYSSLSHLRHLAAAELKIDRSFVLDLESSTDARAIVDAVVKLAQALGLRVVAEGVEAEGQQKILQSLGCDELQGFLFAAPMSANALAMWAIRNEGPRPLVFRPSLFTELASASPVRLVAGTG